MNNITYGKQWIEQDDIDIVTEVLRNGNLTQGEYVPAFEKALTDYTGAKYAVSVSSGTAALHIVYQALGLSENHEVISCPLTFAATLNAALYLKAKPVFTDIHEDSGLINEYQIEKLITDKTKIIAPVHYAGLTCNMDTINYISHKYNIPVVEDACHAVGSKYKDSITGSCEYSRAAVFSFHPVKHITTGEGGAVLTNDKELYNKCVLLRSHGMKRDDFIYEQDSPLYHEMQFLGYNYRMTDIQAALGLNQLKKIDRFIERRREIAQIYYDELKDIGLITFQQNKDNHFHSYHLFPILFKTHELRNKVFKKLKEKNIFTQIHYMPVNKHPFYQNMGYKYTDTPIAYDFYLRELSIPMYPKLTNDELFFVIENLIKILKEA